MDFPALAQRIIHPRIDTPEAAWQAAANSAYAGAIMAANHLLWVGRLLSAPEPVGPALLQLGFGFAYILLASLAFRRSRVASIVILILVVFDGLVEIIEITFISELRFNTVVFALALVLAIGGLRGANAVFSRHGKPRP